MDRKVILALLAGIFFLFFAVYCNRNKKKWIKDWYEKLWSGTKSQGIVDHENELKGNMPLENTFLIRTHQDAEDIHVHTISGNTIFRRLVIATN